MSDTSSADQLRVSMVVSDIDSTREVLSCIDDVGATVRPETLEVKDPRRGAIGVDLSDVTPKQWEALELAFDRGYYDSPRAVGLSELADDLSISKSAVSQRLRAAESTLVRAAVTATRSTVPEASE
ncbi:bacterio-opsin activator [Natronococcus pandeyae]|uniref:Bacterio-opsin activator n=1 Tax=Natronococcus pandeyae TaxID=2055836 RepID=A0A8J8Q1M7_9EURY|nr:helix-turn-helix domain-containing protein [Natronococcus pandeyae]TYL38756.1 bacterio-opsin activator [Natronococcus pandeyae]